MTDAPRRLALALGTALAVAAVVAGAPAAAGAARAGASAAPPPPCFGAAARDPERPCADPRLRFGVTPTPDDAELQPSSACTLAATTGPPNRVCAFGTPRARAVATIGLLGDSHAPAWRSAVDVLARAQRWRGLTVRRSSCPFSFAQRYTDRRSSDACFDWVRASLRFFARHPEIRTVFVIASSAYDFVPARGHDAHATAVAGYAAALSALPASVTRVVVLRDNPLATDVTLACVDAARRRHRRADLRCALPRAASLLPDALAEAAAQPGSPRVRSIDLSRFFCDERLCYPVVGGALVYKDKSHITTTFGVSLGPYLLRAFRALDAPVPPAA